MPKKVKDKKNTVAEGACPFCGKKRGDVKICPHCNNSGITG